MFWENHRRQLASTLVLDPCRNHIGSIPEDLEIGAYQAESLRAGHPHRALFIRRLIRKISQAENLEADTNLRARGGASCISNSF